MRYRDRAPFNGKPDVGVSVEVLEKCLDRVALAIDRAGKRGAVYLPILALHVPEDPELGAKEINGRMGAGTQYAIPNERLIEIDLSKTTHANLLDEV